MKRILRYASPILSLLLLGAWGWSVLYGIDGRYGSGSPTDVAWHGQVQRGVILVTRYTWDPSADTGWWADRVPPPGFSMGVWRAGLMLERLNFERLGFVSPFIYRAGVGPPTVRQFSVLVPFWLISLPPLLIAAALWVPWLREWKRARRVGFEVESKPAERATES